MGKTSFPNKAKPHSGNTVMKGSSQTRRANDPVETGARAHAHEDKTMHHEDREGGHRAHGSLQAARSWRPGQMPSLPGACTQSWGPDGKPGGSFLRTQETPVAGLLANVLKEKWTRGTFTGRRSKCAEPGGQDGTRDGEASRAAPSGNVEKKATALLSSTR